MTESNGTRDESIVRYDDRLPVRGRALLPAIAMGVGAGLAVFYVARLMAERTTLGGDSGGELSRRSTTPARIRG